MKMMSAETARRLLDYDPETGEFRWKTRPEGPAKWNSKYAGKKAGSRNVTSGYIFIQLGKGHQWAAHRIAWLIVHGILPDALDHISGVRDDNRMANLRVADAASNGANKAMQKNNTSGIVGVSWEPKREKWRARVNFRGKMYDAGFFATLEDAAKARNDLAEKIHGHFATTGKDRPKFKHHRDRAHHDPT